MTTRMMVLRMSKLLVLPQARDFSERSGGASGSGRDQPLLEDVVPEALAGPAGRPADVGEGELRLRRRLGDLLGTRLTGPLRLEEQGPAAQGQNQHGRRRGDPETHGARPGHERNDLAAA